MFRTFDARDDYDWAAPCREYISQGLYLPALQSQSIGHVVLHVDCSRSTEQWMQKFAAELNGVLEARPCRVTVLYGDTQLQGEPVEWCPSDGPLTLERRGGGGTCHQHLAEYVKDCGEDPAAVIALTDGYTSWPEDYGVPTLWCITPEGNDDVPFGQVVNLK